MLYTINVTLSQCWWWWWLEPVGDVRARPGVFVTQRSLLLREAAAAASIARPSSGLRQQTLLPSWAAREDKYFLLFLRNKHSVSVSGGNLPLQWKVTGPCWSWRWQSIKWALGGNLKWSLVLIYQMHWDQVVELIEDFTFFKKDHNIVRISKYNFISFLTFQINLGKF